ncbi:MAG: hypothetical protein Q8O98_00665, partial [bacterium]|nr:hypothetical protein [bacterium]
MKNTTAISLILISVGIFYTFISPQYEKVKAQRAEAAQYEEVLDTATTIVATRDTLMEKYRTIPAEDLLKLKKLL